MDYTVFGMERGICRGMRVERCRDIYLVPKNSELQAIVFFSFFRQIAFIFLCVIKSQIELHKQEQERKIMYNVWQQFCPQVRLDMSFTFPQH